VIYSSNYQPFGVGHGESGSEEFRYTGKPEDDASGLYYYGARYYDPSTARFITARY
jgi:RHS repeat-associated protein